MHGAGNDFVLLPDLDDEISLDAETVRALCDRRFGVGGDGVIRAGAAREGSDADVFMDYRNADGTLAEMCGNGVRTIARWVADRWRSGEGWSVPVRGDHDVVAVDTRGGVKDVVCHRDGDGRVSACTVDMGAPVIGETALPLRLGDGRRVTVTTVSMGNPHAVIVVADVDGADVAGIGPLVERHEAFPEGTNVEFIRALDRRTVQGRVWERGVGETPASGTGCSAMAVGAAVAGLADRDVAVRVPGGTLQVRWTPDTLYVTGPAAEVFSGEVDVVALRASLRAASAVPA